MERSGFMLWRVGLLVLTLLEGSSATLSRSGINYEVVALMAIKNALNDRYNVLENWDINSVDPCYWRMVTCSADGYVSVLGLPSQSLTGTLSPSIANLSNLQSVLLQNNAISGPIPAAIGKLEKLQTLYLSSNKFNGEIPSSLGDLKNLNYLKLNNNSLTGSIPDTLSKVEGLTLVDLSFNNFSSSVPKIDARTFKIIGNPLICGPNSDNNCSVVYPAPVSFPPDGVKDGSESGTKSHRVAVTFGVSFGAAFLIIAIGHVSASASEAQTKLTMTSRHGSRLVIDYEARVLQKWCRTRTGYLPGAGTRTGTAARVPDMANSVSVRLGELVQLGYAVDTPGYGRTQLFRTWKRRNREERREERSTWFEASTAPTTFDRPRRPSIDL
ncbi:hypothetical protein TEA_007426 [Camellia sinensis var. sinensis]|uniref:Leucine-rich repeat-containing N-terminal plant-type domain-containing protein n=1 Tax=Camellia sinensis var. sinensis TaxID=542762 RepID=A0A4V3WNS9_CAMSN|nr:hypothetical protein TEA_007426 [Camellia sinensis var. sinensis]